MRQPSLKHRLLLRIGALFVLIWIAATISTKLLIKAGTRDFLNQHTLHSAQNWISILSSQHIESIVLPENSTQLLTAWADNQVIVSQGPFQIAQPSITRTYLHEEGNYNWIISTTCQDTICVAVGFRDLERRYAARRMVALISLPLLLVLLLTAVGVYYLVQSGLRPLNQLAALVAGTPVEKLEAIGEDKPMQELHPLIEAINQLITNLKKQLLKERKFLDTCAHELRTPIAALVAQIQSSHFTDKNMSTHFKNVELSALRTIRVSNQLLSLAKNSRQHLSTENKQTFDLCELTRCIISDSISTKIHIDIKLKGDDRLIVYANSLSLEIAIRNIIENAFRYGANKNNEKDSILVICQGSDKDVFISVEDNGIGVCETHREKLAERFYRAHSTQNDGAGLGLSIVKEIVESHNGKVTIGQSDVLGGFKITLNLCNIIV